MAERGSKADALLATRLKKARSKMQSAGKVVGGATERSIPARPAGSAVPLSVGQERLWFLERLAPGTPLFNICRSLELHFAPGRYLEAGRLNRALRAVMVRHEALRFRFEQDGDGEPRQRPLPSAGVPDPLLPRIDLSGLAPEEGRAVADALARREASTPVGLRVGPPWRARLIQLEQPRLLLTFHHLVFDGWSLAVFLREVSRLYPDETAELPPVVQYGDFAIWERRQVEAAASAAALDYWRDRLAGLDPLELPGDRPLHTRPVGHRAGVLPWRLSSHLRRALTERMRADKASLFMGLLATWAATVGRWPGAQGEDRVAVGTPLARRGRRELEGVVGFFVNTLALVVPLGGNPTLEALVGRGRKVVLEGTAHGDFPFARVVQEIAPERTGGLPLYRVTLALQNTPGGPLKLPGLERTEAHFVDRRITDQDLILSLEEGSDSQAPLTGTVVYNSDLFEATTVHRFLDRFRRLLEAVALRPQERLEAVSLISAPERHQLLVEWNDTALSEDSGTTAWEFFRRRAEERPDAPAVVSATGSVTTYGELAAAARRLAVRLRREGAGPERVVAVVLPRSLEQVQAILGIVATGAAYLPLDPRHPVERLRFMAGDAGATQVIADAELAAELASDPEESSLPVLPWDRLAKEAAGTDSVTEIAPAVEPDHLAYLIYTSGSTGRPKGVMLCHRSLINLVRWYRRSNRLGPGGRSTLLAGPSFDASVWEFWSCLGSGATLHIPPASVVADPRAMLEWLAEERLTHVFLPTPLAEAVLELDLPEDFPLQVLGAGGDRLHRRPDRPLPFRLNNLYGPAECTVISTWTPVPTEDGQGLSPTVGRPIDGAQVYLLSPSLHPVPIGVPGELCLGGVGLARGYRGRPARTAGSFVPDPFSGEVGARLYRTGDLARRLPDGEIDFLGRRDNQVKLRGFRIELGEIENRLQELPGVVEAAVLALPHLPQGTGDPRLVAYLATPGEPSDQLDPREIRKALAASLPDYMVPTAWAFLEALPVNTSGKVDRKALARIEPEQAAATASVAPRTPLEEVVAEAFREVLGVGGDTVVGAHEDFFALGGHSLLAPRLTARLKRATGVELPLEALFAEPTVAALAAKVARRSSATEGTAQEESAPPLTAQATSGDLPLSFAQQRLWLVDRMDPGSPAYNVPTALDLEGDLEPRRLAAALAAVVARQASLRTVFPSTAGEPVQRIVAPRENGPPGLPVVDLSALPESSRQREVERLLVQGARRSFDLEAGPLFRGCLLRYSADRHTLALAMHHIVTDGWSGGVLLRELSAAYEGTALPPLPVQYGDFSVWQRRWLQGAVLEERIAAERQRLAALPVLELPTDRPRPAVRDIAGDRLPVRLPATLTRRLKQLGAAEGLTLFMTLLATYQALLHRLTGETDLAVGTPVAGRGQEAVEGLIGFFVNTLVMRTALTGREGGDPTFPELAARVRSAALEAYAQADVPFEKLVEVLAPERNLAHTPLFQVMLILQNAPLEPPALPGVRATLRPVEAGISKFELTLALGEQEGQLVGYWVYSTQLFDRTTVERLARSWRSLVEGLVEGLVEDSTEGGRDRPLSHIPLLTAAERHQTLVEWTTPQPDYGEAPPVHEQVAAQARRTPDAVALRSEGRSLTYAALWTRSGALAARLRSLGVGAEDRVALYFERGFDMVVAVLAVLRSGGAYVPLDPANPAERTAFILRDTATALLLTHRALEKEAGELADATAESVDVMVVDEEAGPADVPSEAQPDSRPVPAESAAYVIYTSGSTGRPKGVVVSHRSLADRLRYAALVDFHAGDAFLQKTTLAFDVSILEIFGPLVVGGRVILSRPGGEKDAAYLVDLMSREEVTQASFPPTLLEILFLQPDFAGLDRLRTVITGGETVPVELPGRFYRRLNRPGVALLNRYGPTETTISVTSWRCRRQDEERSLPIGRPTAKALAYVLDSRQRPLPVGSVGELCLGGPGVARGYLGRPRRTAGCFVPDPFGGAAGARLYRSGDLVRYRPDGTLDFVGRVDRQVKVRGFRVELGEIEAALRALPGVQDVAVVDFPEGGSRRLAAFWVAADTAGGGDGVESPDARALQRAAAERLPGYMIPSAFLMLDRLPLSPTGKIDRKALPAPRWGGGQGVGGAPTSPREQRLAALWETLLQRPEGSIGQADDFFSLGGHSLLAVQLLSRLRDAMGVDLPLRALFEAPTVAGLAALVADEEGRGVQEEGAEEEALAAESLFPYPSFSQERLRFFERLHPGTATFQVYRALRLRGAVDEAALERALTAVVERHEVLRLAFGFRRGESYLREVPASRWTPIWTVVDLPAEPEARRQETERYLCREALRPFDLERGPLFHFHLLREPDDNDRILLMLFHHTVFDGWSMGIFLRELALLYGAFVRGAEPELPALPMTYRQFALFQRRSARSGLWDEDLEYWRDRLEGAPRRLDLPTDHAAGTGFPGRSLPVVLPSELAQGVEALARDEGATPFMVLLAAYAVLLCRYSDQREVVLGFPNAGRDQVEWEGLIGLFVNPLPLRLAPAAAGTFRSLVARAKEEILGALAHQRLPFEEIIAALQPERSLTESPLFQVMFAFHTQDMALPELPGVEVSLETLPLQRARLTLSLVLRPAVGGGYRGNLEYRSDLFEAVTAERLLASFEQLLAAAVADPEVSPAALPLLDEDRRRRLLEEWGRGAEIAVGAFLPVHRKILEQVRSRPQAPAVLFADDEAEEITDEVWSYAKLGATAAALAARLRERSVRRGDLVAVRLERSPAEVATLLAVWLAGAAYLPLDTDWPEERAAFVLEDARPRCLVTSSNLPECPVEGLETIRLETILLETAEKQPDLGSLETFEPRAVLPQEPAYVIYTSGSTGRPKGVEVHHGGLANLVAWHTATLGEGPDDRATRLSGLAFDASVWELWPYLAVGAAVCIPRDPEIRLAPQRLRDWLVAQRVTHTFVPTPMGEALLALPWPEEVALTKLHTAGDKLHHPPPSGFPVRVFNHYGPTETTVQATWTEVPPAADGEAADGGEAPSIGAPIGGLRAYIVDDRLEPVPPGVAEELWIGGVGVTRGYRGRPALTAAAFTPDPFSEEPGARLYRTGDRVRWRSTSPDGEIDFLGRLDRQVKIRGFRIELGEVETVLTTHPEVRHGAVEVFGEGVDRRLVAYAETLSESAVTEEDLLEALRRRLPGPMVPSQLLLLETMPLTFSGKIDRRRLPRPEASAGSAVGTVPPRNPLEARLLDLWLRVLPVGGLGVEDDFFAVGGHSLLAARLVAEVEEEFGRRLPLASLFEGRTVARMAALLEQGEAGTDVLVPLRSVPESATAPPLFLVHPVGGTVYAYTELVAALGRDRAVYAFQAPGVDGGEAPMGDLPTMARRYREAARRVQPEGPLHLAGWSMGGVVAFEMARQEATEVGEPGPVVLIDSWLTDAATARATEDEAVLREQFARHLGLPTAMAREVESVLQGETPSGALAAALPPGLDLPTLFTVFCTHARALAEYSQGLAEASPYPGSVLLLSAGRRPDRLQQNAASQWRLRVAPGQLLEEEIPEDHFTLLRGESARTLARRIESMQQGVKIS